MHGWPGSKGAMRERSHGAMGDQREWVLRRTEFRLILSGMWDELAHESAVRLEDICSANKVSEASNSGTRELLRRIFIEYGCSVRGNHVAFFTCADNDLLTTANVTDQNEVSPCKRQGAALRQRAQYPLVC